MTLLPLTLLLHGWGGSSGTTFAATGWLNAIGATGRKALAINLPGHGGGGSHDPADYADLAGEIGGRLPTGPVDIIGYSLGAKLALHLASSQPDRFRRIIAIGVGDNIFAPEPSGEDVASALERGIDDDTPTGVRAMVGYSRTSKSDSLALAAILRRPPNPVIEREALNTIGPRTLLINGADDRIAMPDGELRAALPGLTYIQLSGVNHLALPGDEVVRRSAIAFLDAADEREAGAARSQSRCH